MSKMFEIKQIQDINTILPLHLEIFGKEFPMQSYYKKSKTNNLHIFVYEFDGVQIGYSIVVDQAEIKNLYAWYGGVLPEFQGMGVTRRFFDDLIEFAKIKEYNSITLATSNVRPHMLRLAIKLGFDIVDIKKRETGEGNKIYFEYKILPESIEYLCLEEDGKPLTLVQVEERIVRAYKNNCTTLKIECNNENVFALKYIINYCNSFLRKPKLEITYIGGKTLFLEVYRVSQMYNGQIQIIN